MVKQEKPSKAIYKAVPRSHFGGSSRVYLQDAIREAMDKVRDAITGVSMTAPHGRDFAKDVLLMAFEAHDSRLTRLESVLAELEAMWIALDSEEAPRSTSKSE